MSGGDAATPPPRRLTPASTSASSWGTTCTGASTCPGTPPTPLSRWPPPGAQPCGLELWLTLTPLDCLGPIGIFQSSKANGKSACLQHWPCYDKRCIDSIEHWCAGPRRPVNGAALLAAAAEGRLPAHVAAAELVALPSSSKGRKEHKHKDEDRSKSKDKHKKRDRNKSKDKASESKLCLIAAQLKSSVQAMRQKRIAREEQERLREKQLLRHTFIA